jgi:hypothetical protein
MSNETIDPELQTKLVLSPAIHMTRDDVTEAIQEWIYRRYGVNVPNLMVKFDKDQSIYDMKCQDVAVLVRLCNDDVREILNRLSGAGVKKELEYGDRRRVLYRESGIPVAVIAIAAAVSERFPDPDFKAWATRFFSAAKPGADLSLVKHAMMEWLLTSGIGGYLDRGSYKDAADTCRAFADLHGMAARGEPVSSDDFREALDRHHGSGESSDALIVASCSASDQDCDINNAIQFATRMAQNYNGRAECGYLSAVRMADKLIELMVAAPMAKEDE